MQTVHDTGNAFERRHVDFVWRGQNSKPVVSETYSVLAHKPSRQWANNRASPVGMKNDRSALNFSIILPGLLTRYAVRFEITPVQNFNITWNS